MAEYEKSNLQLKISIQQAVAIVSSGTYASDYATEAINSKSVSESSQLVWDITQNAIFLISSIKDANIVSTGIPIEELLLLPTSASRLILIEYNLNSTLITL